MHEPRHYKTNKMSVRPAWASARASAQSDQSLRWALNRQLRVHSFFLRTSKTLIRLGGCPGWSESSLGEQSFCWFCHVAAHMLLYEIESKQWIWIQNLCHNLKIMFAKTAENQTRVHDHLSTHQETLDSEVYLHFKHRLSIHIRDPAHFVYI